MKTILYNPIFINPQAYYVFPRLTRYLQPDNESTAEPANYIDTIEVKVIAYGDTTLKRTYTNTDSIDLSEFKNTWIRISLFTKVGSCVLGEWKIGNMESDLPYIDPEVLASLKAVVIVGNKTNNDSDRAIVKNLVDPDNPFVISNAAFKLNSGFGKYSADFESFDWAVNISQKQHNKATISLNGRLCNHAAIEVDEMKVNIIGNVTELIYWYIANPDDTTRSEIRLTSGINTLPKSYAKDDGQTYNIGFAYISGDSEITIEQIPSFEGAFVTDGIDDLIKSTKSATEMLDGSNEVTVVSMIHQIKTNDDTTRNNWFFTPVSYLENRVVKDKIGKTGIYGYTSTNVTNAQISDITPILGDKNDYTLYSKIEDGDRDYFTVEGFQNQGIWYVSSIAWYWTIIANKVLTTDQINQVIAYFNLDRTLKPDILCNTIKQGITNENHAEFGDKLIDYSGNGRDIQLNNIAWDGDSGIGKYNYPNWKVNVTQGNKYARIVYYDSINGTYSANFKGITDLYKSYGLSIEIRVNRANTVDFHSIKEDGIYTITPPDDTTSIDIRFGGENVYNASCDITITQIPSHAGALCLDGVNGFGKVTGMPIYKDYTFIIDYERISYASSERWVAGVVSKSHVANQGAFILMTANTTVEPGKQAYSFGGVTSFNRDDFTRALVYQSKYKCGDVDLTVGEGVDSNTLWLGTFRDNDQRFFNGAIYSLMSFPYSMSEFLIERQLKKHKLGTLYPDMVEFRPVIKANANYNIFYTALLPLTGIVWEKINIGDYIPVGRRVAIQLSFDNEASELVSAISSQLGNISITKNSNNKGYTIFGDILKNKSPQKINITIDEYIRYEDIVQPYPEMWVITQNAKKVSWGDKLKVGSEFGYNSKINLLSGLYSTANSYYNGKVVKAGDVLKVEKQMVFACDYSWIGGTNEPKCILSPSRLRIPNSSYKILGYIPDISGHGNHGVIHNSAYALNSGANGYTEDFTKWTLYTGVKCTDSIISLDSSFNKQDQWILFKPKGSNINQFTINIKGIPDGGNLYLRLSTDSSIKLENGINEISSYTNVTNSTGFFIGANGLNLDWSNLVIEQVGEYEGAYCLDGVDDFVTIPTTVGGKQVLMKVNSRKSDCYLYDQRNNWTQYLGIVSTKDFIAYNYSNQRGKTYIDGILNENITANDLIGITHNITVTNNRDDVKQYSPCIGTSFARNSYAQMALYDFMLFDEISTDDKIKELNEYVGIEAKVELPPYYWDAYGKTNLDEDKATIQQRGVAEGDYDLTNYNHAYDKMSGYGGYNLGRFDKSWASSSSSNTSIKVVQRNPYDITLKKLGGNSDWEFNNTELKVISNPVSVKFKSNKNIRVTCDYHYYPVGGNSEGTPLGITSKDLIANKDAIITISPISQENIDKYNIDVNRGYYLIYFQLSSTLAVNEEVTIEMLPLYPNGLVYDGVEDYSVNINIPALTDYTYVFKRELLNLDKVGGGASLYKGSFYSNGGRAFIVDINDKNPNSQMSGYSYGNRASTSTLKTNKIIYGTKTSINGVSVTPGSNTDNASLTLGKWDVNYKQMVFYKLILYPKTIPLLQINFLKNLMERDEIIDLNNKIFIQE